MASEPDPLDVPEGFEQALERAIDEAARAMPLKVLTRKMCHMWQLIERGDHILSCSNHSAEAQAAAFHVMERAEALCDRYRPRLLVLRIAEP